MCPFSLCSCSKVAESTALPSIEPILLECMIVFRMTSLRMNHNPAAVSVTQRKSWWLLRIAKNVKSTYVDLVLNLTQLSTRACYSVQNNAVNFNFTLFLIVSLFTKNLFKSHWFRNSNTQNLINFPLFCISNFTLNLWQWSQIIFCVENIRTINWSVLVSHRF